MLFVRKNAWLCLILVLYVGLALLYSLSTPFFETTDEVYHFAYIRHLADGQGFPALDPHNPARQEATQPPLYYLVGALLVAPIQTDDIDTLTRLNPHYRPVWDGVAGNNRNRYLHTVNEIAPRSGAALALRLLRLFSIALGGLVVMCAWFITRALFPQDMWMAGSAAAFCAFNPRFLYTAATINNDVMVAATCALTGLAAARLMTAGRVRLIHLLTLSLALGAALLSKISALVMLPVAALALTWAAWQESHRAESGWSHLLRRLIGWGAVVLIGAALISGWWFARNAILLNGDWTGSSVHVEKWGRRLEQRTWADWRLELQGLEESYWAVFGLNSIPIERWVNLILFAIDRLTVLGLLVLAVKQFTRHRLTPPTGFAVLLLIAWAGGNLVSVLYWMYLMTGVNLGRLLYPALPAIALLMTLALSQFVPSSWRTGLSLMWSAALLVLAATCPFVYIIPNYARPPVLKPAQVGPLAELLDANLQGQIRILGYSLDRAQTRPGEQIAVTVYYESLTHFGIDYTVFVHLTAPDGQILVQQDTYPGMGRYPTTLWRPGDILADTFYLTLPPWTPTPGRVRFEVGFYNYETEIRLLVVDESGQAVADSVWFGHLETASP